MIATRCPTYTEMGPRETTLPTFRKTLPVVPRLFQNLKHFQETKISPVNNTCQNKKHFPAYQNNPGVQNTSQNPNILPRIQNTSNSSKATPKYKRFRTIQSLFWSIKTFPRIQNTSQKPNAFPTIPNTTQNTRTLPRIPKQIK